MKAHLILPLLIYFSASAQQLDYQKDVTSPEAITAALYSVISGDAGQPRD